MTHNHSIQKCKILVQCMSINYNHNIMSQQNVYTLYYILIYHCDIAGDKNAKCTMQYCISILDFVYYNFNFYNVCSTCCMICPIQVLLLYYHALFKYLLNAYTTYNHFKLSTIHDIIYTIFKSHNNRHFSLIKQMHVTLKIC